jgi:hypothetical protein
MLLACSLGGCGNGNSIEKVRIGNATNLTGYEAAVVCDTCAARSDCGVRSKTSVWATDHFRQTGHASFSREACRSAMADNWQLGVRGPQMRDLPNLADRQRAADGIVVKGMPMAEVQRALGSAGKPEQSDGPRKVTRFRQSISDGAKTLARDVWVEFDPDTSAAAEVRYGAWKD